MPCTQKPRPILLHVELPPRERDANCHFRGRIFFCPWCLATDRVRLRSNTLVFLWRKGFTLTQTHGNDWEASFVFTNTTLWLTVDLFCNGGSIFWTKKHVSLLSFHFFGFISLLMRNIVRFCRRKRTHPIRCTCCHSADEAENHANDEKQVI